MWSVYPCLLSVATLTPPPGIFSESVCRIEQETVSMASLGTLCRAPTADLELLAESLTLSAG